MQTVSDKVLLREMDADELLHLWETLYQYFYHYSDNNTQDWDGKEETSIIIANYKQITGKDLPLI